MTVSQSALGRVDTGKWANMSAGGKVGKGVAVGGSLLSQFGKSVAESAAGRAQGPQSGSESNPVSLEKNSADIQRIFNDPSWTKRQFKTGGRIKKTGVYRLHSGEVVIPADLVKRVDKARKGSRKTARR